MMETLIKIIQDILSAIFSIFFKKDWVHSVSKVEFDAILEDIEDLAIQYGYKRGILSSQIAVETDFGKRIIDNNLFNRKIGKTWEGQIAEVLTHEEMNGLEPIIGKFRVFESYSKCFFDYVSLISGWTHYLLVWEFRDKPAEYFFFLEYCGYATHKDYANMMWEIYNEHYKS